MRFRRKNGLTLIVVVIFIIMVLILIGISINFIIRKDTTNEVGTIIETPEKWKLLSSTEVATVYAVDIGNGERVPIPYGFFYGGGNLDTGVIISDNEEDKYDGEIDKTTWEYTKSLKGNQFVWIPCEKDEYVKTNFGMQSANWDTTIHQSEKAQIEKYGGFYVGRYEAGLAETIPEHTVKQIHNNTQQVFNKEGVPQSKADVIPWMFIDWTYAKKNAESMYDNNYVYSGLITGAQWDVMLNKFVEKEQITTEQLKNSLTWGNCMNNSIKYNGRMAREYVSGSWYLDPFQPAQSAKTTVYSSNNGDLLTTGASKETHVYHTFDVAGNLWEWTEEASTNATSNQYRVYRGGACNSNYTSNPVCFRGSGVLIGQTNLTVGFRVVLYLK